MKTERFLLQDRQTITIFMKAVFGTDGRSAGTVCRDHEFCTAGL